MPEESNAYITVEASRFPQARPRTLYPTEDVLNEIKILNQEVEGQFEENDVTSFKSSLLLMIFSKIIFNNSA